MTSSSPARAAAARRVLGGDPWISERTVAARSVVSASLAGWVAAEWGDGARRLLDFGCGDMLLARLLPSGFTVDGYDVSDEARRAARASLLAADNYRSRVYDRTEDVPDGAYDGIVAHSVVQYLPSTEAFGDLLVQLRGWLRPDPLGVLVTDAVPAEWSRAQDAWDLTRALVCGVGLRATASALAGSALRSPSRLLRLDEAEVRHQAALAGMSVRRLDRNLSPISRRATFVFETGREGFRASGSTHAG